MVAELLLGKIQK